MILKGFASGENVEDLPPPMQELMQVSYDPRSYERNLCNCVCRSLKNKGLQRGLNP